MSLPVKGSVGERRLEAVILVRINDLTAAETIGQRSICVPLTEIGPETIEEWVASALRQTPDPVHSADEWSKS